MCSSDLPKTKRAVRYWLLRRFPACKDMVPLMSESLERRLSIRERFTLMVHLLVCVWCARYLKQVKLMRRLLRQEGEPYSEGSSASLSSEARERIASALNHQTH